MLTVPHPARPAVGKPGRHHLVVTGAQVPVGQLPGLVRLWPLPARQYIGIGGAALDPLPNATRYPSVPVAWLSETLRLNWTAAPWSARHGFTVRVTLRPPKLVVDVRCPAACVAVPGTNAVALEGDGGGEWRWRLSRHPLLRRPPW